MQVSFQPYCLGAKVGANKQQYDDGCTVCCKHTPSHAVKSDISAMGASLVSYSYACNAALQSACMCSSTTQLMEASHLHIICVACFSCALMEDMQADCVVQVLLV